VRTLVELASIELFGRLAKVPYWRCLGAPESDAAVQQELRDWYDAMASNPSELIAYFQTQLRNQRIYGGPVDGLANPELGAAVVRYRSLLGLLPEPKLNIELFRAYLRADHAKLAEGYAPVPLAPLADAGPVARGRGDPFDGPGRDRDRDRDRDRSGHDGSARDRDRDRDDRDGPARGRGQSSTRDDPAGGSSSRRDTSLR